MGSGTAPRYSRRITRCAGVQLSATDHLAAPTKSALKRLDPTIETTFVAGPDVLSDEVIREAKGVVPAGVVRVAGPDRYATNTALVRHIGWYPWNLYEVFLATGMNYPDALASIPITRKAHAPLLLTQPTCLPSGASAILARITDPLKVIRLGSR